MVILELIVLDNNEQLNKNYIFSMRIDKQQHKLLKEINELLLRYINILYKT